MPLFLSYIRQRRMELIVFSLFFIIFAASFILYHLPIGAVLYPTLLCFLSGVVFITWDFSRARKKHETLSEINKMASALINNLPEPQGIDDDDYQAIIRALQREVTDINAVSCARYRDLVEYYTLWVHQIKTPITSMRLSLEKEDTALSKKLSSDLLQIEQYVEMVLILLRLDADISDYVFKEYALDDIVEQSISKFAGEFITRKIRLNYTPSHQTVVTDEKWLSFVIEQILSNALKYTREGEIRIFLQSPKTLRIDDTGIGIDSADLPRVFEKGYTGFNGRSDNRSSGIGLYLCHKICKNLGVEIQIDSKLGEGTSVSLNLTQYQLKND